MEQAAGDRGGVAHARTAAAAATGGGDVLQGKDTPRQRAEGDLQPEGKHAQAKVRARLFTFTAVIFFTAFLHHSGRYTLSSYQR